MKRRKRSSMRNSMHSKSSNSRSPIKHLRRFSMFNSPIKIYKSPPKPQIQESFLEKINKVYASHSRLAEFFLIHFVFLRPQNGLDNLNSIPDLINFRFSFWDFEEFYTPPGILSKPKEYKVNHLLTSPILPIIKYNMIDYYTQDESQKVSVEINYDPSINNFINYKTFLNYLVFRELFIEIYDYEKQMPYGYAKLPLSKFLRSNGARFIVEQTEISIYDNFTHEQKGSLGLSLKSEEMNTKQNFDIIEQNKRLNLIDSGNNNNNEQNIKNKKVLSIASNKIQIFNNTYKNEEDKNYNKNIDKIKISIIGNQTLINQTKYKNSNNNIINDFNIKKTNKLEKTIIAFNNKNNTLTLSLIQGQPHYFNYIINNNSNTEQLFHIVISTDENKYSNNHKNDIIINFVSNSEEYEYITMLNKLIIPTNYNSVSENGNFILGPQKSIPLLFKCLSYKSFSGLESNFLCSHSIIIYNMNGHPINCLKVKILKVFPIIDFEFLYKKSKECNKKIEFINPFKNMTVVK